MGLGRFVIGGIVIAGGLIAFAGVTAGQPPMRTAVPLGAPPMRTAVAVGLPQARSGGRAGHIPACRVSSLNLTATWLRQGTELAGLLEVVPRGSQVCYVGGGMSTNPSIALLDDAGRPLPLQRVDRPFSNAGHFIIPRRKHPARTLFVWTNWCLPTPSAIIVVLAPGDGPETLRARLHGASPPCTDRTKPSLIMNEDLTGEETTRI